MVDWYRRNLANSDKVIDNDSKNYPAGVSGLFKVWKGYIDLYF